MKKFASLIRFAVVLCLFCGMVFCTASCSKKDKNSSEEAEVKKSPREVFLAKAKKALKKEDFKELFVLYTESYQKLSKKDQKYVDEKLEQWAEKVGITEEKFGEKMEEALQENPELLAELMSAAMEDPEVQAEIEKSLKDMDFDDLDDDDFDFDDDDFDLDDDDFDFDDDDFDF